MMMFVGGLVNLWYVCAVVVVGLFVVGMYVFIVVFVLVDLMWFKGLMFILVLVIVFVVEVL